MAHMYEIGPALCSQVWHWPCALNALQWPAHMTTPGLHLDAAVSMVTPGLYLNAAVTVAHRPNTRLDQQFLCFAPVHIETPQSCSLIRSSCCLTSHKQMCIECCFSLSLQMLGSLFNKPYIQYFQMYLNYFTQKQCRLSPVQWHYTTAFTLVHY